MPWLLTVDVTFVLQVAVVVPVVTSYFSIGVGMSDNVVSRLLSAMQIFTPAPVRAVTPVPACTKSALIAARARSFIGLAGISVLRIATTLLSAASALICVYGTRAR